MSTSVGTIKAAPLPVLSSHLELSVAMSPAFGAPDRCVAFFSSKQCPACARLEPRFRRLAGKHPDLRFVHVTASRAPDSACTAFGVSGVPGFLCFDRGVLTDRFEEVTYSDGFDEVTRRIEVLAAEARAMAPDDDGGDSGLGGIGHGSSSGDEFYELDGTRLRNSALVATLSLVHPLARPAALVAGVPLGLAVLGAHLAVVAAREEEYRQAMSGVASGTSSVDWLPVVSQCRSVVQALAGDSLGALRTQERFSQMCPLVSQCRSLAESMMGDNAAARRTQFEQLKMLRGLISRETPSPA